MRPLSPLNICSTSKDMAARYEGTAPVERKSWADECHICHVGLVWHHIGINHSVSKLQEQKNNHSTSITEKPFFSNRDFQNEQHNEQLHFVSDELYKKD